MLKKRSFWIGILIGFWIGFFYGWLSIWATYNALEKASMRREAELEQVKRIIYYSEDILQQRKKIFDWNLQTKLPTPEWVVGKEEQ